MILIMGTPKKVPLILGNPHLEMRFGSCGSRLGIPQLGVAVSAAPRFAESDIMGACWLEGLGIWGPSFTIGRIYIIWPQTRNLNRVRFIIAHVVLLE